MPPGEWSGARRPPSQLLVERGKLSSTAMRVLRVTEAPIETLGSKTAWSGAQCRAHLVDRLKWGSDRERCVFAPTLGLL